MKKSVVLGMVLGIGIGIALESNPARAAFVCRQVHASVPGTRWKPAVGYFMSLRTNPKNYWSWARAAAHRNEHPEFLAEGLVSGDFHYQNMAARARDQKAKVDFMDLDDGGRGPFVFDFVRYLVTGQAIAQDHVAMKPVIEAYIDGILGTKMAKPKRVAEVSEISAKKLEALESEFQEKTVLDGKTLNLDREGLTALSESTVTEQTFMRNTAEALAQRLGATKVLDVASRRRVDGGSQGFLRVWSLLKFSDGSQRIYEAKEIGEPAIAEFGKQLPPADRIQQLVEIFWKEPVTDYGILTISQESGDRNFWFRPRGKKHFKTELPDVTDEKALAKYTEEVLYFANYLGRRHGQQDDAKSIAAAIEKDPKAFIVYVTALAREYYELSRGQFENQEKP